MDGETAIPSQEQDSSGMVRSIVSDTPGAISYVAFSYVTDDVNVLSIDGVAPTDENVTTNDWKVWAYEHMYTKGEPTALTAEFLEYILRMKFKSTLLGILVIFLFQECKLNAIGKETSSSNLYTKFTMLPKNLQKV